MRHLLNVVLLAASVSSIGCAARFSGELDGAPVPPFSSAALATFESSRGGLMQGLALPTDPCTGAVDIVTAARDFAGSGFDTAAFNERGDALAATLNRVQPEDQWRLAVNVIANVGLDAVDEAVVDLDNGDTDIFVQLQLCKSDGEATVRDGFFDERQDCYRAVDGDIELTRDGTSSLRLLASKPLTFVNQNGAEDGDVAIDIELSACNAWIDEVLAPSPASVCFQQCIQAGGWPVSCASDCRGGEGEGEGEGEFVDPPSAGEGEGEGKPG